MQQVIIITGASSGMGKTAVQLFNDRGWLVYAGARHENRIPQLENTTALRLDVTDDQSVQEFVDVMIKQAGRIDALLNVAGYGEYGIAEEVSMGKIKTEMDTNFLGAVRMAKAVLPTMRKQGSGRIVNVSSGVGVGYLPTSAYYAASKAALQIWSDTLDTEVTPFGIRSTVVMPGSTNTNFLEKMFASFNANKQSNSPYLPIMEGIKKLSKNYRVSATADDLAHVFYLAVTQSHPKLRYFNSFQDRLTAHFARNHPGMWRRVVEHIVKSMMTKYQFLSEWH